MTGLLLSHHLLVLSLAGIALALAFAFYFWKRRILTDYEDLKSGKSVCPGPQKCTKKAWTKQIYTASSEDNLLRPLDESQLALQESEAYLRMLYNNLLDPAFLIDFHTKQIVDSNQAARDFYGYTKEEFSQMTPADLHLEEDGLVDVLDKTERPRVHRRQHCKKDGGSPWVEIQQSYFEREGKKFNILNLRDITEQVEIQEAFEKNYRRLVEAQEIAKIGNWEYHIDTRKCWASEQAHRIFAHQPDAKGFIDWADMLEHFEDSPDMMRSYHEFIDGKLDMLSLSHEIVAHDKVHRSIEIIVKLERDDKNKPLMLFGTVEDVSERRDLEKQLQADARRESFLARCLRLMLKSHEVDKTVNKIIREVGDYFEADEVLVFKSGIKDDDTALSYIWGGREGNQVDTKPQAGSKQIRMWLDLLMQGPKIIHSISDLSGNKPQSFLREEGINSLLSAPIMLQRDMWGRIAIAYFEENKKLSDRDTALLETLARVISLGIERSQRENALLDERNRAESASQAKSEFLANMSHEIRTPMTAILGFADILAYSQDEDEKEEAVHTIRKNGQFLLKVINDILDFSKIEANRIDLESKEFNLLRFLGEIESLIAVSAKEKGIAFRLECPDSIPETITTDPLRLKQILLNLLGNAIKFTTEGHVSVVTELVEVEGKQKLQFQVIDTGIGISEEQLPCLFKPFTQADSSVTRRFGGSGLGLTISARLAEMLGGSIQVMSEVGVGSVFTVQVTPSKIGKMVGYERVSMDDGGKPVPL
ncbi:MAG: ATP-binding protein, partial [Planctomycetia bacterium]